MELLVDQTKLFVKYILEFRKIISLSTLLSLGAMEKLQPRQQKIKLVYNTYLVVIGTAILLVQLTDTVISFDFLVTSTNLAHTIIG